MLLRCGWRACLTTNLKPLSLDSVKAEVLGRAAGYCGAAKDSATAIIAAPIKIVIVCPMPFTPVHMLSTLLHGS